MKQPNITPENAQDWYVCGLMVQALPQKIMQISTALLAIPHTEIPVTEESQGKIVVVMQSHDQQILLNQMESVKDIEGVVNVSLIYHQQDEHSIK
ncbi:chaperone NapD [Rodentibacter caecimuris]|uniref:Chaperone NapD n=1 Tax=Rodentibacter caecimuris TaxID=1796644 RepID=A0ABX3KYN8_9PAST|nr:nitrate reductase [Rodentibacter heylii]